MENILFPGLRMSQKIPRGHIIGEQEWNEL